jgi:hypothetical protein
MRASFDTMLGERRRKKRRRGKTRYLCSPLAVGLDGSVIANLLPVSGEARLLAELAEHRDAGRTLFVGVVLRDAELESALAAMDDAAAEITAWLRR